MKKSGLKALPIAVAVTLALMICPAAAFADGTARMDAVDSDSFFGTWRPITETRATLTLDGYASDDLILENGELVMDEDDGDVIKYVKK